MEIKEKLYQKFEDIPKRKGPGGRMYHYVRWQDVADRMNSIFGHEWTSEVVSQDIIGNNVIVRVRVTVPGSEGRMFTQEGFGGSPNNESSEAGNPFKAAYSKALKDACKRWGVGLYLEEEDDDVPSYGAPMSAPMSAPMGSSMTPAMGITPPADNPFTHGAPMGVGSGFNPTPPVVTTSSPSATAVTTNVSSGWDNTPVNSFNYKEVGVPNTPPVVLNHAATPAASTMMAPPSTMQMPSSTLMPPNSLQAPQVNSVAPSTLQDAVAMTPPVGSSMTTPSSSEMPGSKAPVITLDGVDGISDVQKVAVARLVTIVGKKKMTYEELVTGAFAAAGLPTDRIPSTDDLTHEEAVIVIKYGNENFRNV